MSSKRARVLFVVPSAFPVGGLATWLDTLLPDLTSLGWDAWLGLSAGRVSDAARYLELHPFEPHVLLENKTGSRRGRKEAVERALATARPDAVVVANLVDVAATIAARRASGARTPHVGASIHTLLPGLFADLTRPGLAFDALIAPNRLVVEAGMQVSRFDPERILYASYGVDLLAESPPAAVGGRLDVVYAGRFEQEQKRVLQLPRVLEALDRRTTDWTFEIAGAGPAEDSLRLELGRFGGRVRWRGALAPERARDELLRAGRILLLTSHWELGPVVAWEALGRGVTVVAPRFIGSGLEGALRDGETALLYPFLDAEAAADRILTLREPERRTAIAEAGWREARSRFSRAVAARAWDEALERLLALPQRSVGKEPEEAASGRLERWFGGRGAERLRRIPGLRIRHLDAGGEWPHTRGGGYEAREFFARLEALDFGPHPLSLRGGGGRD